MKRLKTLTILSLVLLIGFGMVISQRNGMALEPDYASGVNNRNGDASPAAGFSTGETNSRVDDYINQDEQINLDVDSGLVKVLRTNQKTSINDYVEALIPCKNVNPRELRGPIRYLTRKEGGDCDVVQDKVQEEYFLHVTCPKFQLPYIKSVVENLDEEWVQERQDGSAELYYEAQYRDIADVLNITKFYRGPEGSFQIDTLNNALYYHDQPAVMGLQKWGLSTVDIPENQVSFEVAIYEVDASNDYRLGLDYIAWKNGPGRNLFTGIAQYAKLTGKFTMDYPGYGGPDTVRLNDIINPYLRTRYAAFNFLATAAYVDFLTSRGKAKLLTKTTVVAKSGSRAEVSAVQEVATFKPGYRPRVAQAGEEEKEALVKEEKDASADKVVKDKEEKSAGGYDVPTGIPRPVDFGWDRVVDYVKAGSVGVRVTIIPFIGQETAEADIDITVSDINGYSPQGAPIIHTRYLYSYARLKDNVPYVLGGIKREETIKNTAKIPLLGDIPVLGWLAGGEQDAAREKEVVIVVTPKFQVFEKLEGEKEINDVRAAAGMELSQDAQTVMAQVEGEQELSVPRNPFGFDQWLLDTEK